MKVTLSYFPEDMIKRYNLLTLENNGYVLLEINKGMYGLKQAAVLAYTQLSIHLRKSGYRQILGSTGMWKHITRRTVFCLYVDNFGVKYFTQEHADYLLATLGAHYKYTVD